MAENKKKPSKHSCDILIIGGGSAGLRAAVEAHDIGAHVLIISKSRKGDSHTVLARGGINPTEKFRCKSSSVNEYPL